MAEILVFFILNIVQKSAGYNNGKTSVFAESDPYGVIMAIIGMAIVFSALILLYVIFINTPIFFTRDFRNKVKTFFSLKKKSKDLEQVKETSVEENKEKEELSGEVNAAIAAAIYLYKIELHDYEEKVLTISKVSRTYSPWNSKIYGLRNNLNADL